MKTSEVFDKLVAQGLVKAGIGAKTWSISSKTC
jgi:hypothetical protein